MSNNENVDAVINKVVFSSNNQDSTDAFIDPSGKTIRWESILDLHDPTFGKACFGKGQRILSEIESEAALQQINNELFEKLDVYDRAIANWKRLKIVIVILKMCHGKLEIEKHKKKKNFNEELKTNDWNHKFARFVILPTNKYIRVFKLIMGPVYLASIC